MLGRLALICVLLAAGCVRAPYTNRRHVIVLSPQEEASLGAEAFQQVVSESRVERDPRINAAVEEIGRRLATVANRPDFQWSFVVIDDDREVNAFAVPGGGVAVYTGILPIAQDQAGLAVVVGHEIAHVIARHGAERISQPQPAEPAGQAPIPLGGGANSAAILAAYGLGAPLPYGRTQESEADRVGLLLMAQAGYDPRAAIGFWERMERSDRGTPQFRSTHPGHGTRLQQLGAWMPEATRLYEATTPAPNRRLVWDGDSRP